MSKASGSADRLSIASVSFAGWAAAFVVVRVISLIGLAANDLKALAIDMKRELEKMGISVTEADAERMIREMSTHKVEIQNALQLMQGLEPHTSTTYTPPPRERVWKGTKF